MTGIVHKPFEAADETRPFEAGTGKVAVLETDHGPVGQAVFEPGWRWSLHVKPIAGTDSCESAHVGYCLSGRMKIVMDDGESAEVGPGEFLEIPPGHDAWVIGDEPCVMLDWAGFADYAKPPGS